MRTVLAAMWSILLMTSVSAETLLIADKSADALLFFDTDERKVTHSVPVGGNPHEVVLTRDGRFAITSNPGSNTLSFVDFQKREEVHRLESPLFSFPHGMAVHPNGKTLYLTSERKKLLISIDPMTCEVVSEFSTGMGGSHMVVLSPDGTRAYITNRESGTVSLWETAAPHSIQHADAGSGAEGIALTHDGRWLLVANRNDNDLHLFDASDLSLQKRIPVGAGPVRVAVAPDDRRAFVTHRASAQVHVIDLEATKVVAEIPVGEGPGGMAFGSKGERLYVANTNEGTVSILDLGSLKILSTHDAGEGPDGMLVTK